MSGTKHSELKRTSGGVGDRLVDGIQSELGQLELGKIDLTGPDRLHHLGNGAAFVHLPRAGAQRHTLSHQTTRAMFDFTAAEARVAALIGQGLSIAEAAQALGSTAGTVRNQLKAVFAKAKVSRQVELSVLLSRV